MRAVVFAASFALAAAPFSAVTAQSDAELSKQIVNDPTNPQVTGAKASLRDDPKAQGGKALRIDVPHKGSNPWDSTVGGSIDKPIKRGDNLVLVFTARLEKGANGPTTTLPYNAIQLASAPYSTVMSGSGEIGPEWKQLQVTGKADRDYPAGALKVTIQLATAKQIVDFGPIILLDRGQ